jgi:hypothetical protein
MLVQEGVIKMKREKKAYLAWGGACCRFWPDAKMVEMLVESVVAHDVGLGGNEVYL